MFLFLPLLARCDFPELVKKAGYPGTKMVPATQALLSALGLKLSSTERKSHVMDLVFDQGFGVVGRTQRRPQNHISGDLFA
jgi:hypothetical protein